MSGKPYPKVVQLGSVRKQYRRKVASRKQWEAMRSFKLTACRVCGFTDPAQLELHHLVTREDRGDDVPENLVPLCRQCHSGVSLREPAHCRLLLTRLLDAEYAYMVTRGGEDYPGRAYGIEYQR